MASHKGIYLRAETYWITYIDIHGRQRRESSKSKKISKAISLLRLRQGEVEKGEQPDTEVIKNHLFKELAVDYLEFCEKQKNYSNKKYMIDNFCLEFGNLPLKNFTTKFIEKYQSKLLSTDRPPLRGSIEHRPPIAEATVNRRIATLKAMFTKAKQWKMCNEATCKAVHEVEIFSEPITRDMFLSIEQIDDLIKACDSRVVSITGKKIRNKQDHLKPVILFALNTGCRRGEILGLKWSQVDMVHKFINLQKTKNGESRQLPINDTLRNVLENAPKKDGMPFVFFDENSGKKIGSVKRSFKTAVTRAGFPDFVFHSLRHTFASHLVMGGVDLTTVSRLLGHKSLSMTLRYAHLAPNHLDTAVNVLNSIMPVSIKATIETDTPVDRLQLVTKLYAA